MLFRSLDSATEFARANIHDAAPVSTEEDTEGKSWKWEIWPHPYDHDYDYFVTDDDNEAREAILHAAEMYLWDSNDGEERVLKVIHNN